ncbi:hypothetical protein P691DRAFT_787636, partial [Macrolepiota fuliginosa MF-IS2]
KHRICDRRKYILNLKNEIQAQRAKVKMLHETLGGQQSSKGGQLATLPAPAMAAPWYNQASSLLPQSSLLKRAMLGPSNQVQTGMVAPRALNNDTGTPPVALATNQAAQPTGVSTQLKPVKTTAQTLMSSAQLKVAKPNARMGVGAGSDVPPGPELFNEEPDSDHDSDSDSTRCQKREVCKRHHAQLKKLQYQAQFVKIDPPFVYKGEIQALSFKWWCQEIWA